MPVLPVYFHKKFYRPSKDLGQSILGLQPIRSETKQILKAQLSGLVHSDLSISQKHLALDSGIFLTLVHFSSEKSLHLFLKK